MSALRVTAIQGQIERLRPGQADAILLVHGEGDTTFSAEAQAVNRAVKGRIKTLITGGEFTGKSLQLAVIHVTRELPVKWVLLVGLGKKAEVTAETIRQTFGVACRRARDLGARRLAAVLPTWPAGPAETAARAATEGAILGLYQFTEYRTEDRGPHKALAALTLVLRNGQGLAEARGGVKRGQIVAEATNLARDLGNQPSNVLTPTRLAEIAKETAERYGFGCQVLGRPEIERLGMGALLGVAKGSHEPPRFIILEHHGANKKTRPIVLVGKTITFDSGGISIKPAEKMEQMKDDMSGGAAVLATIRIAAQLKLPLSVIGLLPATENMPGGAAIKPGDVLKSLSGKTIEVINTDAEGRLILADALTYATRYKPTAIVDVATLTGACVVALGQHAIGAMGNRPRLLTRLREAGEASGERVWELPLWPEYYEQIKSDVADVKNVGGRGAGAITAGAFLSKFVKNSPWAHLDIAGTSWSDEVRPTGQKGATGAGVRVLSEFLARETKADT